MESFITNVVTDDLYNKNDALVKIEINCLSCIVVERQ